MKKTTIILMCFCMSCIMPVRSQINYGMTGLIKYALRPFAKLFPTHYMENGVDCAIFQFGKKAYEQGKIAIFKTVIDSKANDFKPEMRDETRKKFDWENKTVYGFIGRYVPQKNPVFLMEIFGEIAKRQPEAHFVTIGFGDLEDAMMEKAKELCFADRLENLGRREDIKQFYNAFDAFILPSLYEGLPVVGVEAQCSGLPLFMSTEVPTETKACDLAHFISLKEPAERWAELIINETAKNKNVRTGKVKEIVETGFDSEEAAKRLENYYITAVAKT